MWGLFRQTYVLYTTCERQTTTESTDRQRAREKKTENCREREQEIEQKTNWERDCSWQIQKLRKRKRMKEERKEI